jgi:hypothetical protein
MRSHFAAWAGEFFFFKAMAVWDVKVFLKAAGQDQ